MVRRSIWVALVALSLVCGLKTSTALAQAVYGSANPNLAGGVLARATGRPLTDLVRDLLAEPLGIRHYHLNLTPTGTAYMGGGAHFLPRDFMKLGQLLLNGGTWNGRRVLDADWCRRATAPLYELRGLGERQLRAYVESTAWRDARVAAVEEEFSLGLDHAEVHGRWDRLDGDPDSALVVVDYKTGPPRDSEMLLPLINI